MDEIKLTGFDPELPSFEQPMLTVEFIQNTIDKDKSKKKTKYCNVGTKKYIQQT